jgi:hypothetical protein
MQGFNELILKGKPQISRIITDLIRAWEPSASRHTRRSLGKHKKASTYPLWELFDISMHLSEYFRNVLSNGPVGMPGAAQSAATCTKQKHNGSRQSVYNHVLSLHF